jgi:hypothetical protein
MPTEGRAQQIAAASQQIGGGCHAVTGRRSNVSLVQALIDNLIERGLDPRVCRLFIVDGDAD